MAEYVPAGGENNECHRKVIISMVIILHGTENTIGDRAGRCSESPSVQVHPSPIGKSPPKDTQRQNNTHLRGSPALVQTKFQWGNSALYTCV